MTRNYNFVRGRIYYFAVIDLEVIFKQNTITFCTLEENNKEDGSFTARSTVP